mgnify:CR=1 FL=1
MRRFLVTSVAELVGTSLAGTGVSQPASEAVPFDSDDIGGVVRSESGVEAGVWVIAETNELPTGFRKIVVTDELGRYLVPDLPSASYDVWVRGYGPVSYTHLTLPTSDLV